MEQVQISKVYDPKSVEDKWYDFWLDNNYFTPVGNKDEAYTIVIPPPNVTGSLHMGHALDNTLQDILIRWYRMLGYDALWMPGSDHAGIATQIKVESHLAEEGVSRHDLGREKFIEKVWEWKEKYHARIVKQLQKLGVSCDWSRERFTMDEGCSQAVKEVFVKLYQEGLIYQGNYIINWCPRCITALSDIEVEHEDKDSTLTHFKYPFKDGEGFITVATTRPETMLGDTAVAVSPQDERYQGLIGKTVILPLINREIPVIADEYVDPEFGSGAVKVTPAHDPNDFEIGMRHGLEQINVISDDGKMTQAAGAYAGLDRYECRKKVVADMEKEGFLVEIEDYNHSVGHCQRCSTAIEPLLSKQWFVKMKPLAEPAIKAVKEGNTRFVPERFTKTYLNWVENIRDWCISRQIWWGHRIPAWYCSCGETIVSMEDPTECPACGSDGELKQDPDVLDTWFSSALWPFSTMGWPEKTRDLEKYFPTSTLVTGYDIIYFWVARMIFMSLEFMDEVPFKDVYIHGLVRDSQGRKMSKSLGNGIDPLEVIDEYGADTLRFTLITGQAPGNDMRFRQEHVEASRNFANKIWNASRFVLMNLGDYKYKKWQEKELEVSDRWLLHRYNNVVTEVTRQMKSYELGDAARIIYEFLWGDYCDWYVEIAKMSLYGDNEAKKEKTKSILCYVLKNTLALLHPFMPFVTEELWQQLPREEGEEALIVASWPTSDPSLTYEEDLSSMELIMETVKVIRNLRSEVKIPPQKSARVVLRTGEGKILKVLAEGRPYLNLLAKAEPLEIIDASDAKPTKSLTSVTKGVEVFLPIEGLIDLDQEVSRLEKEQRKLTEEVTKSKKKLENQGFVSKAPKEVIEAQKAKLTDFRQRYAKVEDRLKELKAL